MISKIAPPEDIWYPLVMSGFDKQFLRAQSLASPAETSDGEHSSSWLGEQLGELWVRAKFELRAVPLRIFAKAIGGDDFEQIVYQAQMLEYTSSIRKSREDKRSTP